METSGSDDEMDLTDSSLKNDQETENTLTHLPKKSREKYDLAYNQFITWHKEKKLKLFTEQVILSYFDEQSKKFSPNSLWTMYSMLRSTLNVYQGIDITHYGKLKPFLKNNSDGYNPKKTKTFTSSEIEKFLNEAPDEEYLLSKVILIVWISGACTIHELTQLKLENIKDLGTSVLITIPDARTKKNRAFTISGKFYAIFKKYLAVRKSPKHQNRFFLYFTKLMKKPVGIHKIASVPKEIAIYLQLKDPELYTRNCIRRCSAASTVDITSLKRNEGCIATALALADKIADVIENAVPKSSSTANKSAGRMKPNCNFEEVYIKQEPSEEMIDETNEDIRVPVQRDIDENLKCTDYSRLPNDNNSRLRKEENTGTIYIKQEYVGTEELNKDTNSCNVSRNYDMFNAKSATNNDNIVVKEEMINPESADTELYTTLVENIKKE